MFNFLKKPMFSGPGDIVQYILIGGCMVDYMARHGYTWNAYFTLLKFIAGLIFIIELIRYIFRKVDEHEGE